ncbi:MAG TPA: hypothetical protein VJ861_02890 [Treponemataceae bacterium]|nr:hypothetical protein [Treponemataceae bacterium]
MQPLSDLQKRMLHEEYPNLNFSSDEDVERYFDLRNNGRQADALYLYNTRLTQKYPDIEKRQLLIKYYRCNDSRYQTILLENLSRLADRLLEKTKYIISFLTKNIRSIDMTDAYSVIKLAEELLSVISPDRYKAINFTEKYLRYAQLLSFHAEEMAETSDLIRLYVTDTLENVQEFKKEHEKRRTRKKQMASARQKPTFDLSQITFLPQDISRILLPSAITRIEDTVIAYCMKYWDLVGDSAFEKTIVLYSRKYNTKHSEIFYAIKNGRDHGWKDEEILNSVLSSVVTGYYYSISGDVYLQRTWARYKAKKTSLPIPQKETSIPESYMPIAKSQKKVKKQQKKTLIKKALVTNEKTGKKRIKPFIPATQILNIEQNSFTPNSISDMIKKMTGKTYTVYKELFFRGIRPAIRTVLSNSKKGTFFDSKQNSAEELIYEFLFLHFNDPYQNWEKSETYLKISELGYEIPKLEPIISTWIKNTRSK